MTEEKSELEMLKLEIANLALLVKSMHERLSAMERKEKARG